MTCLAGCVNAFEASPLDDAARRRVITYLNDRYLPDAVEEEE